MTNPRQLSLLPQFTAARRAKVQLPPDPGKTFRALLAKVLAERERCLKYGWSRVNPAAIRLRMAPLQQWLLDHPAFVSTAECQACWRAHANDIAMVTPSNHAGRRHFMDIQALIQQLA